MKFTKSTTILINAVAVLLILLLGKFLVYFPTKANAALKKSYQVVSFNDDGFRSRSEEQKTLQTLLDQKANEGWVLLTYLNKTGGADFIIFEK